MYIAVKARARFIQSRLDYAMTCLEKGRPSLAASYLQDTSCFVLGLADFVLTYGGMYPNMRRRNEEENRASSYPINLDQTTVPTQEEKEQMWIPWEETPSEETLSEIPLSCPPGSPW